MQRVLAAARASPFFWLALDMSRRRDAMLIVAGEFASELSLAVGRAHNRRHPSSVALGIAVCTTSLVARRRMKTMLRVHWSGVRRHYA